LPAKFAYVDGTAVHYVYRGRTTLPGVVPDFGKGELLVFLHDAGGNAGLFQRVMPLLDQHSTLAFDFPAHGRSGGTTGLESIEACTSFFASLVRAMGLRPAVLIGHGMGAAVALRVACAYPETIRALVLVAAVAQFDVSRDVLDTWRSVMHGRMPQPFTTDGFSPKTDFAVMREAWGEQVKTDPRVRYSDLVACAGHDSGVDLSRITAPALLVSGNDDRLATSAGAAQLQARIGGAKLVTIADAGHMLALEKPSELAAEIKTFLSDLSDKSDNSDTSDKP